MNKITNEQVNNNLKMLLLENPNMKHKWCLENITQYILNQDTTELLEALELLNRRANSRAKLYFNDITKIERSYGLLYKALGGQNENNTN